MSAAAATLRIVTIGEFVEVDEPGAEALLGADGDSALIPEGGDIMVYGEGGAGKTTLAIDMACSLAAGDDWLGIPIRRPVNVLLVECEGPRPALRKKLARKRAAWRGSTIGTRLRILEDPWASITFADETHRQALAEKIAELEVDVVIIGPLSRIGMEGAGTLQEIRDFMLLVSDVRRLSGRPVAIVLIHHQSKAGQVSGAWEGATDTLLHVQGQGHGRTRLYIQKARWSSEHHGKALHLVWADGDSFTVEDRPEITEDTITDALVAAVTAMPGASWTKIRDHGGVRGNDADKAKVRDRLIKAGDLINTATREGHFNLWLSDDPAAHRADASTAPARLGAPPTDGNDETSRATVPDVSRHGARHGTAEPWATTTTETAA